MNNLSKILEKHNFIGEDITDIIKDALIEFALEYDINPCTSKIEIEKCAIEFCKPQTENAKFTYIDEEYNVKINYE